VTLFVASSSGLLCTLARQFGQDLEV
jgi:hypothetical protein